MKRPDESPRVWTPEPGTSQHCAIFGVEIAGFAGCQRDDEVQLVLREALYRSLIAAFDSAGVGWATCSPEDRGNGVLVIVPLHMPTAVLIHPLLTYLRAGLRRHNRLSSEVARIRLRVAIHIGEVHHDEHGFAGTAVSHLFRMLAAAELKTAPSSGESELAFVVSDHVYDSVIRHGPALIDPETYRPVIVVLDDAPHHAWIHGADIALASRRRLTASPGGRSAG